MKTLLSGLVAAVLMTGFAATVSPVAAQRVAIDVRIGTPGYHSRHYRHDHRLHRRFGRPLAWHYGYRGPVIVVAPRPYYHRRPIVVRRPVRLHRHYRVH
jgi:hypothetical protein